MRWSRATVLPTAEAGDGPLLEARGVTVELGGRRILDSVDLVSHPGEVLALVGPNGAGKSTLLGVLAGDIEPSAGEVLVAGRPLGSWSHAELGMRRSVLTQQLIMSFPFSVVDVVRMGRAPWSGTPAAENDNTAVADALRAADVAHLAHRSFLSLSGGERARAALARVLAQDAGAMLLDEPTAALDIHHTEVVLTIARAQAARSKGLVVVLHDLGLAAAHADRVAVIAQGRIAAVGPPAEVLEPELLSRVYEHDIEVLRHPVTGELLVLPRRGGVELRG